MNKIKLPSDNILSVKEAWVAILDVSESHYPEEIIQYLKFIFLDEIARHELASKLKLGSVKSPEPTLLWGHVNQVLMGKGKRQGKTLLQMEHAILVDTSVADFVLSTNYMKEMILSEFDKILNEFEECRKDVHGLAGKILMRCWVGMVISEFDPP